MGCGAGALALRHSVESIDAELVAVARKESGLRLRLGQVLEVMQRKGCCFELGFSSLGAYALERCERGVRWVEVACCLARRLESLPLLRAALASGQISWSAAELLARVARPESEAQWLERAQQLTVRQLRAELKAGDVADWECIASGSLRLKLDREESSLLEATLALLDGLGTRGAEAQVEALLAEGQSTLLAALPASAMGAEELEAALEAQRR